MNIQSLSSFLVGCSGDHCGNAVQDVLGILFLLLPRKFSGSWVTKKDEKQKTALWGLGRLGGDWSLPSLWDWYGGALCRVLGAAGWEQGQDHPCWGCSLLCTL